MVVQHGYNLHVPVTIRRRWFGKDGPGKILARDLDKALLIIPREAGFSLLQALFPSSELLERAQSKPPKAPAAADIAVPGFTERHVSVIGLTAMLPSVKRSWPVSVGDSVYIRDLGLGAVITRGKDNPRLSDIAPKTLFETDSWIFETDGLRSQLAESYSEWCAELGQIAEETDQSVARFISPRWRHTLLSRSLTRLVLEDARKITPNIQ